MIKEQVSTLRGDGVPFSLGRVFNMAFAIEQHNNYIDKFRLIIISDSIKILNISTIGKNLFTFLLMYGKLNLLTEKEKDFKYWSYLKS